MATLINAATHIRELHPLDPPKIVSIKECALIKEDLQNKKAVLTPCPCPVHLNCAIF